MLAAALPAGVALHYWGQEFAYAWVHFGDLRQYELFFTPHPVHDATARRPRLSRLAQSAPVRHAKEEDDDNFGDTSAEESPPPVITITNNIEDVLTEDERKSLKKFNAPSKDRQ